MIARFKLPGKLPGRQRAPLQAPLTLLLAFLLTVVIDCLARICVAGECGRRLQGRG